MFLYRWYFFCFVLRILAYVIRKLEFYSTILGDIFQAIFHQRSVFIQSILVRNQANEKGKCSVICHAKFVWNVHDKEQNKIKYPTRQHLYEKNAQKNEKGMKTHRFVTTLLAPLEQAKCFLCK